MAVSYSTCIRKITKLDAMMLSFLQGIVTEILSVLLIRDMIHFNNDHREEMNVYPRNSCNALRPTALRT